MVARLSGSPSISSAEKPACLKTQIAVLAQGRGSAEQGGRLSQYDLGSPRTFSAMKQRISCGVTGAILGIMLSRK